MNDPIGQLVRINSGTPAGFIEARILGITEDAPIDHIGEMPRALLVCVVSPVRHKAV